MRLTSKTLVALFISTFLLVPPSFSATASLEEAKRLDTQVIRLYRSGKYAEAVPLAQRILAIRKKALGLEHSDVATSINNLALLYNA